MTMEKDTMIGIAGAALGGIALILALVTSSNVKKEAKSLNFDNTINVAVAEAETETPSEDGMGVQVEESYGSFNVILRDGTLRTLNSTVRVPKTGDNTDRSEDVFITLDGENTLRYDSTTNYLVVNGDMVVKAIDAVDATYNGICEFMGPNGETILIGERLVNSKSAIAVVRTVSASQESSETDVTEIQKILDSARSNVVINELTLFGKSVNPDWSENVVMTSKAIELIKGSSKVYISPYSGNFADGATNTLVAGDISFTYSDNIKDSSTGYAPYIFAFNSDQNGTVPASASTSGTLKVKILAQNNMIMKDMFE